MIPNVSFVVGYFASGIPVQIARAAAVTWSATGRAVATAEVFEDFEAMPIPGSGRTIQRDRDGQTTEETLEMYTTDLAISSARVETGRPPDVILYAGVRWVVDQVDAWDQAGYRRVVIRREGP